MNNEPVAWMGIRRHGETRISVEKLNNDDIPLYTHPVKEQDESFDRTASHMAGEYVSYKPELTDEEIYSCFHQYFVLGEPKPTHYELEYEDLIEFARAILRKAQEK